MSNENIETVKQCYAAFGRGDINGVMSYIGDDLTHFGMSTSAKTLVPWYIKITKKSDVPKFFEALGCVEHTQFEPFHFAAAGDYVYASIRLKLHIRSNSRPVAVDEVVHRIKLNRGKVVEWLAMEDTAGIDAAFRA